NPIPVLKPQQRYGTPADGGPPPGNPTAYLLLLVPVVVSGEVLAVLEIFLNPGRPANLWPVHLQYMAAMAELASRYHRNQLVTRLMGQQKLWTQLEAFSRQVHNSLNPTEVAYQIANEGRRLIECDRVSVAVRKGGERPAIVAVSNTDVVEKRSNQIYWMR